MRKKIKLLKSDLPPHANIVRYMGDAEEENGSGKFYKVFDLFTRPH